MKKLLIALVLGALLVLGLTTIALADNGPHGGFTNTTDACASCHRMHTATGVDYLLISADEYDLCISCHNGDGAYTNVVDGLYGAYGLSNTIDPYTYAGSPSGQGDVGYGLFGGGFEYATMMHTWQGNFYYNPTNTATSTAVTSAHQVGQNPTNLTGTVWGAGNINNATPGTMTLECTNCHDPHGNAGRVGGLNTGAPTPSYRLLRFQPQGSNGFEVTAGPSTAYFVSAGVTQTGTSGGVFISDPTTKWYTPNTQDSIDPSVKAFRARLVGEVYDAFIDGPNDSAGRLYVYQRPAFTVDGTIIACPATGTYYPVVPGNVAGCAAPGNTAGSVWNNSTQMSKLGFWCSTCHDRYLSNGGRSVDSGDSTYHYRHTSTGTSLACVACHTAHGTSAQMTTTKAQNATLNAGSSVLLKYDNRSICLDCHAGSVNYWPSTTPNLVIRP